MPKINKKTIFKFERIPVSIFQFENGKNYFVRYYVGRQKGASGGNKDKSLKTKNINEAKVKAKKIYFEYLTSPTPKEKEIDFNIDINATTIGRPMKRRKAQPRTPQTTKPPRRLQSLAVSRIDDGLLTGATRDGADVSVRPLNQKPPKPR